MADETYSIDIDVDSREVKKASANLRKFENRIKRMTAKTDRLRRSTQRSANKLAIFNAKAAAAKGPLSGLASGFRSIGASAASSAVTIAALGTAVSVGLIAKFTSGVIAAKEFEQTNTLAFAALTGGAESGAAAMATVDRLSDELGLTIEDTTEGFKNLLAAQFSAGEAETFTKLGGDLKFLGASADEVKRAFIAISQIKSLGRLSTEELNQLSEAKVGRGEVQAQLGIMLGVDSGEIDKLMKQGKISSEQGLEAIKRVVTKFTGKELGEAAAELALISFDAGANKIRNAMTRLNRDVAKESPEAFAKFGAISAGIKDFVDELSRGDLSAIFETAVSALDTMVSLGKAFITGFVGKISKGSGDMQSFFEMLKDPGVIIAFQQLGSGLARIVEVVAFAASTFTLLGSAFALSFGVLFEAGAEMLAWLFKLFLDDIPGVIMDGLAFAQEFGTRFIELGASLIGGIAQGIRNGLSSVLSAVGSVASGAVARFESILGIGSPSKVFAGLAGDVLDGFDKGLQTPSQKAATGGAVGSDSGGGGLGTTNNFNMGGVTNNTEVNEASDGPAIAAQMESSAMGIFGQAFEKMALAGGTA